MSFETNESCIECTFLRKFHLPNPALASSFVKLAVPGNGGDKRWTLREGDELQGNNNKTGGEEADLQEKTEE